MSKTYWLIFSLALLSSVAPALKAQVERASIVGKITDKTGAAMTGVEIAVTHEATNTTARVSTDDAGAFSAVNLIPGSYSVSASRTGVRPKPRRAASPASLTTLPGAMRRVTISSSSAR